MTHQYRHHVRENLLLALDTLHRHKFRSFLTILGVLIGTTTVIAVTSIIAGLDKQLVDVAEQFGTRTLWVYKLQLGTPHRLTREERLRKFEGYQVNAHLLKLAPAHARVMHCLPAHRGEEVTSDVLDGERSVVFQQAGNRMHAQKALLQWLMA